MSLIELEQFYMRFLKQIFSLNQRGIIHLIPLFLILAGIIAGVYLVQHPQIFKPKASGENIKFEAADGKDSSGKDCRVYTDSADGKLKTTCPAVNIKFTSPLETNQTTDTGFQLVKTVYAATGGPGYYCKAGDPLNVYFKVCATWFNFCPFDWGKEEGVTGCHENEKCTPTLESGGVTGAICEAVAKEPAPPAVPPEKPAAAGAEDVPFFYYCQYGPTDKIFLYDNENKKATLSKECSDTEKCQQVNNETTVKCVPKDYRSGDYYCNGKNQIIFVGDTEPFVEEFYKQCSDTEECQYKVDGGIGEHRAKCVPSQPAAPAADTGGQPKDSTAEKPVNLSPKGGVNVEPDPKGINFTWEGPANAKRYRFLVFSSGVLPYRNTGCPAEYSKYFICAEKYVGGRYLDTDYFSLRSSAFGDGVTYKWWVDALDDEGKRISTSDVAQITIHKTKAAAPSQQPTGSKVPVAGGPPAGQVCKSGQADKITADQAKCVLNLRPDILTFYKQNSWCTQPIDYPGIVNNWMGINSQTDKDQVKSCLAGGAAGCTSGPADGITAQQAKCVLDKRSDILPFYQKNSWCTQAIDYPGIVNNWMTINNATDKDQVKGCFEESRCPPGWTGPGCGGAGVGNTVPQGNTSGKKTTTQFRVSEDASDFLDKNFGWQKYDAGGVTVPYTFKDSKPGLKFIWYEFKVVDEDGKEIIYQGNPNIGRIELVAAEKTKTKDDKFVCTSSDYGLLSNKSQWCECADKNNDTGSLIRENCPQAPKTESCQTKCGLCPSETDRCGNTVYKGSCDYSTCTSPDATYRCVSSTNLNCEGSQRCGSICGKI